MEYENDIKQNLDESRDTIKEALALVDKMSALKELLQIKTGSGLRYLQHAQPDLAQLNKAEKAIMSEYLSKKPSQKTYKKSHLVQTLNRKGMA